MAEEKKYYWIKIKDSFMTSDKVDFLMSQKDGANYIVLYQMLCLMCLNTNGELSRKIGEIIIPYDKDKIVRDCKYFTKDTVIVALELFKKLGMIYEEQDGTLIISDFDNMVGSSKQDEHTKKLAAERQAKFRQKNKQKAIESVTVTQEITDEVTLNSNTDIRDKRLDNSISINTNTSKTKTLPEPRNDLERIEKTYYELWDSLYQKGLVSTEKPIIDYGKVRNIENRLLQNNFSVELIQKAILNSVNHDICIQSGYSLQVILSKNIINQLINGSVSNNQSQKKAKTVGKASSDVISDDFDESDIPF